MLIRKDVQIQRLKLVISKLETHMKSQYLISQEEVVKVSTLKEEEMAKLSEMEREADVESDMTVGFS